MKIQLLLTTLLLIFFTGCTISQSETSSIKDTQTSQSDKQTSEVSAETANKSTEVKESTDDTNNDPKLGSEINSTPIAQTPYVVTNEDINGYHDLIKDVHNINLNLDLSDPRLAELIEHLSQYTYNTSPNQIAEVSVPDSLFVLTNKLNHLPEDYVPQTLRVPDIRFSFAEYNEKKNLRDESATGLESLFAGAENDNYYLFAVSGYRSYNRQVTIYNYKVENRGQEEADKVSSRPGHSEHQTGLAMDITSESVGYGLEYEFGQTPEGIWVAQNAHNYGFIIRYPEDKVDITGYNYEPWHLRFVGKDLASYMYENDLTLEELYSSIFNQL